MKSTEAALLFVLLFLGPRLAAAESSKAPAPAKVTSPVKESDLTSITLTAEAEKRLGIETAIVERRKLYYSRLLSGETILPAQTNQNGTAGQSVFTILPSLSSAELVRLAQSQIDADGQVEQARVQLEAAKVALTRAEQLLRDRAGTARTVDESRAQVGLAEVGLHTAAARRDLLGPPVLDIARPKSLWVRVPVYVGDVAKLNPAANAEVGGLTGSTGPASRPAKPVSAPPSANAAAATVDWFYEVANEDGQLQLSQRVGVRIPGRAEEESLVLPWAAIVHDVHGGAWVYEKSGPLTYTRRRIQILRVSGDLASVSGGVKPGASVATTGVAELFGTEFGAGK